MKKKVPCPACQGRGCEKIEIVHSSLSIQRVTLEVICKKCHGRGLVTAKKVEAQ